MWSKYNNQLTTINCYNKFTFDIISYVVYDRGSDGVISRIREQIHGNCT